jgi:hypothetical protein
LNIGQTVGRGPAPHRPVHDEAQPVAGSEQQRVGRVDDDDSADSQIVHDGRAVRKALEDDRGEPVEPSVVA